MVRRRERIVRLTLLGGLILMPVAAVVVGAAALTPILLMPLVILAPGLWSSGAEDGGEATEAEESEDEPGDGGSRVPKPPRPHPNGPRGALPLPTSTPGSWRLRGGPVVRPSTNPRRQPAPDPSRPRRVPLRRDGM